MNSALIDHEPPSPIARAVASADFASGVAADLPFEDWTFPSLDLSIGFVRPPQGDWILLDARWLRRAGGRTVCVTLLSDGRGLFGQALKHRTTAAMSSSASPLESAEPKRRRLSLSRGVSASAWDAAAATSALFL